MIAYKKQYGVKNPCASGTQGGANAVCTSYGVQAYPTFSVICPNKTLNHDVNWPVSVTGFDSYLTACGTTGNIEWNPTTTKFITLIPNPAKEKTTIDFYLDKLSNVTVEVYDISGKKVYTFEDKNVNSGFNYFDLSLTNFESGLYFIKLLQDKTLVDSKKLSVKNKF